MCRTICRFYDERFIKEGRIKAIKMQKDPRNSRVFFYDIGKRSNQQQMSDISYIRLFGFYT